MAVVLVAVALTTSFLSLGGPVTSVSSDGSSITPGHQHMTPVAPGAGQKVRPMARSATLSHADVAAALLRPATAPIEMWRAPGQSEAATRRQAYLQVFLI